MFGSTAVLHNSYQQDWTNTYIPLNIFVSFLQSFFALSCFVIFLIILYLPNRFQSKRSKGLASRFFRFFVFLTTGSVTVLHTVYDVNATHWMSYKHTQWYADSIHRTILVCKCERHFLSTEDELIAFRAKYYSLEINSEDRHLFIRPYFITDMSPTYLRAKHSV